MFKKRRMTSKSQFYGGGGGKLTDMICPEGTFIRDVNIKSGNVIDFIKVTCSDGKTFEAGKAKDGNLSKNITCPTGFDKIDLRTGSRVDKIQLSCGSNNSVITSGGEGGAPYKFECNKEDTITGLTVREGQVIDALQVHCNAIGKCPNPAHILAGECNNYCSTGTGLVRCREAIKTHCLPIMATDTRCRNYVKDNQAKYDDLMYEYCTNEGTQDPICACYTPILEAPGINAATLQVLNANPQCWNANCRREGYHHINILDKPCPNLQLQNCITSSNVIIGGKNGSRINLGSSTTCSQYAGSNNPDEDNSFNNIFIAGGIILCILLLGLFLYYWLKKKNYL